MNEATLIQELQSVIRGKVLTDPESLNTVRDDFGRMVTRVPLVVVQPSNAEDIAAAIRIATRYNLPLTPRSAAHSQSGQALNQGGILIDMISSSSHLEVKEEEKTCTVDAGMIWKDLVEKLKPHKLIPRVLTNNLNVAVGGTLSMAGIGVSSFRYGLKPIIVWQRRSLREKGRSLNVQVRRIGTCSATFFVVLGQFGIFTRAKLQLRSYAPSVRTFFLLYDKLNALMRDQKMLMEEGRMDFIESWCTPLVMGFKKVMGRKTDIRRMVLSAAAYV
jgi:cytokinin dehydrogenase